MQRNFKVTFGDPDPEHRAYAEAALNVAFLASSAAGDWSDQQAKNAASKCQKLLNLLNSDWRGKQVVHVCRLGCCHNNAATCLHVLFNSRLLVASMIWCYAVTRVRLA